jgi:V/A-type H+/Na+-transporting ATPase subunit I
MSTALMKQLIAAVDINHYDAVTRELLSSGVMHFIRMRELKKEFPGEVSSVAPPDKQDDMAALRRRVESLLRMVHADPSTEVRLDVRELKPLQKETIEEDLDNIGNRIESIREKQRQTQQEILRLEEMRRALSGEGGFNPELLQQQSGLLTFFSGRVPKENREDFENSLLELPAALVPAGDDGGGEYIIVAVKKYRGRVQEILERSGWEKADFTSKPETFGKQNIEGLNKQIETLTKEQSGLTNKVEETVEEKKDRLLEYWKRVKLRELYSSIEYNYGKTSRTLLFSGWVPRDKQKTLDGAIRKATGNTCYIEWRDPEEALGLEGEKPPVKFTNPKFLQPFQMLVRNYSIPEYGTFDPTPVVAAAYLVMFGLMFGDAGHGAVLLIAGIIGSVLKRREKIARLFQLIVYCGASAIVFGVLFGSYFGMAWIPPVWFDFHGAVAGHARGGVVSDIYGILTITIYFGIAVIGTGLLINWINCMRKKRWLRLILDKTGLVGGWIYGGGVYTAFYFVRRDYKQLPPGPLLIILIGIPALLFLAKPVAEFIIERREHGKQFGGFTVLDFLMEWIVEMLEVFSGYLANTLSFMRVAGLGIAHVSLMTAFFQIAGMIGGEGLSIGSCAILVFGNLLVIALEGLSAGIQSLRLNYYEFFSKYFSGSGIAYSPVTLKQQ